MKLDDISKYFYSIDTSKNGKLEADEIEASKLNNSIFNSILEVNMTRDNYLLKAVNTFRDDLEIEDYNTNLPYKMMPSSPSQEWDWDVAEKILTKDYVDAHRFNINTKEGTPIPEILNFNNEDGKYMLKHLSFDSETFKNTPTENLPTNFKPEEIIKKGRDAGCKTKAMHSMGYTGKNVKVAIIDTPIISNHSSIKSSIVGYEIMNNTLAVNNEACFHDQAVADILSGDEDGIAPDSKLVYFAGTDFTDDRLQALKKILEINKNSTPEEKIKVISLSWDITEGEEGYNEYKELLNELTNDGVFIAIAGPSMWNGNANNTKMPFGSLSKKDQNGEPDDYSNYIGDANGLLIPAGDRTVASSKGENKYRHDSVASTSWTVPALAGFYTCALECAKENDVSLTPEMFYKIATETGHKIYDDNNNDLGTAIDGEAICAKIISLGKSKHHFGL